MDPKAQRGLGYPPSASVEAVTISTQPEALNCWQCQASIQSVPLPISRHATCDACGYELHVCKLCVHQREDSTSRCLEDRAEVPTNKEVANFCEFFAPQALPGADKHEGRSPSKAQTAKAKLDALFNDPG